MISLNTSNVAREWTGLSTDTKPMVNVKNGDTFFEMDTSKVFMYDEENSIWKEL